MILYLIGFMGSGKSHLGRRLAAGTGLPWRDLDQVIESNEGRTIAEIFKTDGEAYFRARERFWLEQITEMFSAEGNTEAGMPGRLGAIISTGGGAPCFGDNMDWMNRNGITLWLDPPTDVLLQRLEKENMHRPVLEGRRGEALRELVMERLGQRRAFYERARLVISDPAPDAQDILEMIEHA